MADRRVHNSIGERFDIESTRHEDPIRRVRRQVCWVVAIIMAVGVIFMVWEGDNQIYQARPVAGPHRLFDDKCEQCHHTSFHLLQRTLGIDSADFQHGCKQCHSDDAADHHPAAVSAGMMDDCTTCHKEHQGDEDLTLVTDQHCVRCHRDLASSSTTGEGHFVSIITSLTDHPEIALLREEALPESPHGMHQVAEWLDGQWQDRGRLVFNHDFHMDPRGISLPPDHRDYDPGKKSPSMKKLACADCHQPDDEGAYMKPVSYENHCKQCHQLYFSRKLATVHRESVDTMNPLPHEPAELIRGVLRDRLMDYIQQHPEELALPVERPVDPSKPGSLPTAKNNWDWVEQHLPRMEDQLFATGPAAGQGDLKYGCQLCHQTESQLRPDARVDWKIVEPKVPARWLSHARFRHDRHDTKITLDGEKPFACTECHDVKTTASTGRDDIGSVRAGDILMPSIEVCRQCHGGRLETSSGAAADRCTECHRYHPAEPEGTTQDAALLDYIHKSIANQSSGK